MSKLSCADMQGGSGTLNFFLCCFLFAANYELQTWYKYLNLWPAALNFMLSNLYVNKVANSSNYISLKFFHLIMEGIVLLAIYFTLVNS